MFCAWNRRFEDRKVVDASTDLVIEGYPSAANGFAREAFQLTQPGIRIASHLHAGAHVRCGLSLGVPVLVVLREPVGSIASILARFPDEGFRPGAELVRYARFYEDIAKVADQVVLSRFEDTTGRLGVVSRAMNDALGTNFVVFDDGPVLQERVHAVLDAWSQLVFGGRAEQATARPSPSRKEALERAVVDLRQPRHARALAHCEELHGELATLAARRLHAWEVSPRPQ